MPKSVRGVMREFKHGELHSGSSSGPVVTKRKQAVAIALSEQRQQQAPRHRMAGSHDGMWISEHHRGAKKR